jgi:PGF-CTERM protein
MKTTHSVASVALAALLACSLAVAPVAASQQSQDAERSVVVELAEDGDAVVTVTSTYDLTSDEEQQAFESLRNDEAARENASQRYAERLQMVAENANDEVDREMRVPADSADVSLEQRGDVGVVRLSATWENLAAVDGDRLVVTEPFASGYETDRPVVVVAPDGYEITNATPSPDSEGDATATWAAGTSLDGFEATMEASGGAGGDAADGLPGFGIGVALLSILAALALAVRRER